MSHATLQKQLKLRMEKSGLTMKGLSLAAGLNETAVRDILNGRAKNPSHRTVSLLASVLKCSIEELSGHEEAFTPSINMHIMADGKLRHANAAADDGAEGLMEAEPPPFEAARPWIVAQMCGNAMEPVLKDGWLVYYRPRNEGIEEGAAEKICAVALDDGSMWIRTLKKGHKPGNFQLEDMRGAITENIRVLWASKIVYIKQV